MVGIDGNRSIRWFVRAMVAVERKYCQCADLQLALGEIIEGKQLPSWMLSKLVSQTASSLT